MPRQLSFDLPVREARGRGDFFVSDANAAALAMIEGWRDWPQRKLVLTGPEGAGKTHLTHVWAGLSGATIMSARTLDEADIPTLAAAPVAVEDCDRIAGDKALETLLFHLHNLVLAEGHAALFTATLPPRRWPLVLPDLASRMQGTALARIAPPDDALLAAVLTKLFTDRQISPSPATVPYLARRIERSFASARQIVAQLDALALEQGRAITPALAREILDS